MNRAEALIDLSALEYNVNVYLKALARRVWRLLKADGYGHGLIPVAKRALAAGATWLGTALLEEALTLRNAGVEAPIIAWLTPVSDDFESALKKKVDLAIPSLDHLQALVDISNAIQIVPRVHLEVDTGMSRGGALREWKA